MPKETINAVSDPYVVRVGWDHHGSVQVGVEGEGERSLFWLLLGDEETLVKVGESVRLIASGGKESVGEQGEDLLNALDVASGGYSGVWSNLDRTGCNNLIRVLRRARDAAFGRDE